MRKKGTRIITVDRVEYRYRTKPCRDDLALNVTLQLVDPPGQILKASFWKPMTLVEISPTHQFGEPIPHAVTPSVICQLIREALKTGWQPGEAGLPPLKLDTSEIVPELPQPDKR